MNLPSLFQDVCAIIVLVMVVTALGIIGGAL